MEVLAMFLGVTGVVLAAVSIWFVWRVDDRNNMLNLMFTQTLQKIQSESGNIRSQLDNLISPAWQQFLTGDRQVGPSRPSPEIEELRKEIEEIQNADVGPVFQSLVNKLDKVERVQARLVDHLLHKLARSVYDLPPEQKDLGKATFESYRRYFNGEAPYADIPETMVSTEELLGQA